MQSRAEALHLTRNPIPHLTYRLSSDQPVLLTKTKSYQTNIIFIVSVWASIIQIILLFLSCCNRSWYNRSLIVRTVISSEENRIILPAASLELRTPAWCLVKYFRLSGNIKISCWRGHNVPSGGVV